MAERRRLDQIDLRILVTLQREGRITNQLLSERVGLSPRPCQERVRRLEETGVIARYAAILDTHYLPELIMAFAEITLRNQSTETSAVFENCIGACPEVVECYLVSGQFDYIAQIVCRGLERYNALTTGWIDDPRLHIARIVSNFVMKPVRNFAGYPLGDERE